MQVSPFKDQNTSFTTNATESKQQPEKVSVYVVENLERTTRYFFWNEETK